MPSRQSTASVMASAQGSRDPARTGQVTGHRAADGRAEPGQGGGVVRAAGILVPGAEQVTLPSAQHLG